MQKIGKMKRTVITLYLFLLATLLGAQEINFTASAPSVVQSGQQFRLVYTLNAKGSNFKAPDLSNFIIIGGPSTSSSSNISFSNGVVNQSVVNQYTYFLQAADEGTFTIGPAGIIAEGKTFTSNSVSIQVTKGNSNNTQNQQNRNNNSQESNTGPSTTGSEDLFVRIILNKSSVYQGEPILATIKIFTRVNLVAFEDFKFPNFKGFWTEEIEIPNQIMLTQETYNGKAYNVGVLKKVVLFPQKSGELTIDPFEIKLMVQEKVQQSQRNFWDSFFNQFQNVSKKLVSPSAKVTVKPLPSAPDGFTGAVGEYQLTSKANPLQLKTNESLSLNCGISGNGNLRLIELPTIPIPPQFEKYDPKITENIKTSATGVSGSKHSETLLIPRSVGTFKIPATRFVFFNPVKQKYETLYTNEFTIQVEKGESDSTVSYVSGINKEDLMLLGSDVRFIQTKNIQLKNIQSFILPTTWYLISYILLFLAFVFLIIIRRQYIKRNANQLLVKNRRAGKEAKKRLSKAKKLVHSGEREKFFEEILRALWGYYADKLKIETSLLNKELIISNLLQNNLDEVFVNNIKMLIEECEFARYAPPGATSSPDDIYNRTAEVINESEKKLK
ncbi:MAG: hypothetical protein CVU05_13835 [Bacteroidetes bacterium HGW-Bacteroidetes-21]|jgi:hypothetical protein|nr:MAG: hypothetical protein CVU05_13835 [Bacteroidetes bacterium HGW-Bacteroidetes-21]